MDQVKSSAGAFSTSQTQTRLSLPPFYFLLLGTLGMAVILLFTYRLRKSFSH
jgi:hypothetical protein